MQLRQVSVSLDMDNALYIAKIERRACKAKREQVAELIQLFDVYENELLVLWL